MRKGSQTESRELVRVKIVSVIYMYLYAVYSLKGNSETLPLFVFFNYPEINVKSLITVLI
jgi:hypothetical protein